MPLMRSARTPWVGGNGLVSVYTGDCQHVLPSVPAQSVDLVFADPPFNTKQKYDSYSDDRYKDEYLSWTERWMRQAYRVLTPAGSMWVAIGLHLQAEMKILAERVGFSWRDTVCWHYTFGPRQKCKFTPSWVALHYMTMNPRKRTWNGPAVSVPSARQLRYNDKRALAGGKVPDNVWVLFPREYEGCFQDDQNSVLHSRVCGTFKERTPHPCQMPLAVMDRIVRACTNEGDLVLDPFLGSGTTAVAALTTNRRCLGIELSSNYVTNIIVPRVEAVLTP